MSKISPLFSSSFNLPNLPGGMHQPAQARTRFGMALPPKLFTELTDAEMDQYSDGERWVNPDGEYTDEEILEMLQEPGGALRMFRHLGLFKTIRHLGVRGLFEEMRPRRVMKESVKSLFDDPNQDYTPFAVNGIWVHVHDRDHFEVAKLRPIKMGKYEGVNGLDGIGSSTVLHFHAGIDSWLPQYPGMLDEYRVAIHQYLTSPSPISRLRLMFYMVKMSKMVPNPWAAIAEHKKTLEEGYVETAEPLSAEASSDNEEGVLGPVLVVDNTDKEGIPSASEQTPKVTDEEGDTPPDRAEATGN